MLWLYEELDLVFAMADQSSLLCCPGWALMIMLLGKSLDGVATQLTRRFCSQLFRPDAEKLTPGKTNSRYPN